MKMSKITTATAIAFLNGKSCSIGNTKVVVEDNLSKMYLNGTLIGKYDTTTKWFSITTDNVDNQTNTTMNRLNGILTMAEQEHIIYADNMGIWYNDTDFKHTYITNDWFTYRDCRK